MSRVRMIVLRKQGVGKSKVGEELEVTETEARALELMGSAKRQDKSMQAEPQGRTRARRGEYQTRDMQAQDSDKS